MQLYVVCKKCNNKIYLNSSAKVRSDLPFQFYLKCNNKLKCPLFYKDEIYAQYDVHAEAGNSDALKGALILGALGALVGGGAGAVVGGLIGTFAGSQPEKSDTEMIERFNRS